MKVYIDFRCEIVCLPLFKISTDDGADLTEDVSLLQAAFATIFTSSGLSIVTNLSEIAKRASDGLSMHLPFSNTQAEHISTN